MVTAFVLDRDYVVRAYASEEEARSKTGIQLSEPATVVTAQGFAPNGTSTAQGLHARYALLLPATYDRCAKLDVSHLDASLLRTNVRKAVRRQLPHVAAESAMQYLAQSSSRSEHADLLKLLPIMAAEDATAVPLLPVCIFFALGATEFEFGTIDRRIVARCAAQLALAPREPSCVSKAAWSAEVNPTMTEKWWLESDRSPELKATALLMHAAFELTWAVPHTQKWVGHLRNAVCARIQRTEAPFVFPGDPRLAAYDTEELVKRIRLQDDRTLLPLASRQTCSCDFHNASRKASMLEELRQVPALEGVCERSLEVAVEEQSLLNVRDCLNLNGLRYINLLLLPKTPETNPSAWKKRFVEESWPLVASKLWATRGAEHPKLSLGATTATATVTATATATAGAAPAAPSPLPASSSESATNKKRKAELEPPVPFACNACGTVKPVAGFIPCDLCEPERYWCDACAPTYLRYQPPRRIVPKAPSSFCIECIEYDETANGDCARGILMIEYS